MVSARWSLPLLTLVACGSEPDQPLPQVPPPSAVCEVPAEGRPEDASRPTTVVGDGTAASCTEAKLRAAVAKGGVITFDCGPDPVTLYLTEPLRINNVAGANRWGDTTLDGGGKVTLSGSTRSRILYLNACEEPWNSNHCQDFEHPRLVVQNLTFQDGKSSDERGGAAIFANGGSLKIVNCRFHRNVGPVSGQDTAGGAVYTTLQSKPVVIVGSVFGGAAELGNACSNGGALGGIGTSYTLVNSTVTWNRATGSGGNPGNGGNGGGLYNDGNTFTLSLCGTTLDDNTGGAFGGGLFLVSNDGTGTTLVSNSTVRRNRIPSGPKSMAGGLYLQGTQASLTNTLVAANAAGWAPGIFEAPNASRGSLDMTNVTLTGHDGPAVVASAEITGRFTNITVAGNKRGLDTGARVELLNTIIANNAEEGCSATLAGRNNLEFPAGRCTADVRVADPQLGPLQSNGGLIPTETMAPAPGSPAAGAGKGCPSMDQRGEARPADGCTLGAHETG